MKNRFIKTASWAVLTLLVLGAFFTGSVLRPMSESTPSEGMVQATALLKITPELPPVPLANAAQNGSENRELVGGVLKLLKNHFVEPITKEKETAMARGAVRGMLESLEDPDSRFLEPSERKLLDDVGSGKFHGIGAVLALKDEKIGDLEVTRLIVVSAMPGSPSSKAGILPGDSITYIDDKWIVTHDPFKEAELDKLAKAARNKEIDMPTYQKTYEAAYKRLKDGMIIKDAVEALTAKSSGNLTIKVERKGESVPLDMKLQCASTNVDPVVATSLSQGIAYIRISQFNKRAAKEFDVELTRAQANNAKGFVLDLRGNPGGTMDAATEIAGKISGGGLMATIVGKNGRKAIRTARTPGIKSPVVVIVNAGTASVAELATAIMKENAGAVIVGDTTFGDGLIQTPLMLKDGSAAVITTGKMLTPKGFDFNGKGIIPDKVVARKDGQADAQLDEAVKLLLAKIGKA